MYKNLYFLGFVQVLFFTKRLFNIPKYQIRNFIDKLAFLDFMCQTYDV